MKVNDVIALITRTLGTDDEGYETETTKREDVYAKINSISHSEFFDAGQTDLKPELKATLWKHEYGGQTEAEYESKTYAVYRTYVTGGFIELYLTGKVGV